VKKPLLLAVSVARAANNGNWDRRRAENLHHSRQRVDLKLAVSTNAQRDSLNNTSLASSLIEFTANQHVHNHPYVKTSAVLKLNYVNSRLETSHDTTLLTSLLVQDSAALLVTMSAVNKRPAANTAIYNHYIKR